MLRRQFFSSRAVDLFVNRAVSFFVSRAVNFFVSGVVSLFLSRAVKIVCKSFRLNISESIAAKVFLDLRPLSLVSHCKRFFKSCSQFLS